MLRFFPFVIPLDIAIGTIGDSGISAQTEGGSILETFLSVFTSMFNIITGNNALLMILAVAVGAPILGVVLSLFKGR